jgi:hypothetical protein
MSEHDRCLNVLRVMGRCLACGKRLSWSDFRCAGRPRLTCCGSCRSRLSRGLVSWRLADLADVL